MSHAVYVQFRDDLFWMPHNMDFRGRVYPVPPHLSHLSMFSLYIVTERQN